MSGYASRAGIERIIRVCGVYDEERSLRLALLDEVRRVVGFDWFAWLLTDPETEVGSAPLAATPSVSDLPRLVRLKYLTTVNRWTGLGAPVAFLRGPTDDQREQSAIWRDLLHSYEVGDVASMVFRDRFGCWAFLDLWRRGSEAKFSDRDGDFLSAVVGPITEALRRCQARTFELAGPDLDRTGPVVLVLSPELQVRAQTPETEDYLRRLVPPDADRPPIPAGAFNVAAQLVAVESGIDAHQPSARVHLGGGTWLTLRAARIGGIAPAGDQDIAVTIEATSPAERMSLFVRAYGLSAREAELLSYLSTGADTRQVAQRMFLSENTIQDHLKSIFVKTGARNRRTLLARVVGR